MLPNRSSLTTAACAPVPAGRPRSSPDPTGSRALHKIRLQVVQHQPHHLGRGRLGAQLQVLVDTCGVNLAQSSEDLRQALVAGGVVGDDRLTGYAQGRQHHRGQGAGAILACCAVQHVGAGGCGNDPQPGDDVVATQRQVLQVVAGQTQHVFAEHAVVDARQVSRPRWGFVRRIIFRVQRQRMDGH